MIRTLRFPDLVRSAALGALLLAGTLSMAGCFEETPTKSPETTPATTPKNAPPSADREFDPGDEGLEDSTEVTAASVLDEPRYSTFVLLLQLTDLASQPALRDGITVMAPSNAALAAQRARLDPLLAPGTLRAVERADGLPGLEEPDDMDALSAVLSRSLLEGEYLPRDFRGRKLARTIEGDRLPITRAGDGLRLAGVGFGLSGIAASNGAVYPADGLIFP